MISCCEKVKYVKILFQLFYFLFSDTIKVMFQNKKEKHVLNDILQIKIEGNTLIVIQQYLL